MTRTLESRRTAPGAGRSAAEQHSMDPRIAHRRRVVEMDRDRTRRRRVIAASIVIVVIAGLWFALHSPIADVDAVRVEGNHRTASDDITTIAAIGVGEPLVGIRGGQIQQRLEGLPWVSQASVDVSWRGDVVISVTERDPVATVDVGGRTIALDATGRVLGEIEPRDDLMPLDVPAPGAPGSYVESATLDAVHIAVALEPGVRTRVREVSVDSDGRLSMSLRPGGVAILGTGEDLDMKLVSLTTVLAQVDLTDIEKIDLSVPDQPVVVRKASSTQTTASASGTAPVSGGGAGGTHRTGG